MARAHFAEVVWGLRADGVPQALAGAAVTVLQTGTATPVVSTLYADPTDPLALANPLTADAAGRIEFWLDADERVDLLVVADGYVTQTLTVDVVAQQTETGNDWVGGTISNATINSPTLTGTMGGAPVFGPSVLFGAGLTVSGNLVFGGLQQRVTGDFSSATRTDRLLFQTTGTNAQTSIGAIPSGSSVQANFTAYNTTNPDAAGSVALQNAGTAARVLTGKLGAGVEPATLELSSIAGAAITITTATRAVVINGTIGFNGTAAIAKPTVTGSRGGNAALASLLTALANYGLIVDSTTA